MILVFSLFRANLQSTTPSAPSYLHAQKSGWVGDVRQNDGEELECPASQINDCETTIIKLITRKKKNQFSTLLHFLFEFFLLLLFAKMNAQRNDYWSLLAFGLFTVGLRTPSLLGLSKSCSCGVSHSSTGLVAG